MTLPLLRDDSLITTPGGTAVRVSLPWIRSLPLASLQTPVVKIDGVAAETVTVVLGDREVAAEALTEADGWWFQQDRVTLALHRDVAPGAHEVEVEFGLRIPYLQVESRRPTDPPVPRRAVACARRAARTRRSRDRRVSRSRRTIRCLPASCSAPAPSTGHPR